MNNNSNQPRQFDAVHGGEAPPPVSGVVLGGIEGIKSRLKSSVIEVQVAALSEALNYGDMGLDLVIDALTSSASKIRHFAARLLKQRGGEKGKQALLDYDPYHAFSTMTDWLVEEFNSNVGITSPVNTAYNLNLQLDWQILNTKVRSIVKSDSGLSSFRSERQRLDKEESTKKFQIFLNSPQSHKTQALHCNYPSHCFIDIFIEAKNQLSNLKALFWGDPQNDPYKDRSKHKLTRNMSLILEAYPNLEVFHIRGRADGDNYDPLGSCLTFTPLEHMHLKTLIIETKVLPESTFNEIVNLSLPNLEYLELWIGRSGFDSVNLIPIISERFPKLKYLGIRSCEHANEVAKALVSSALIKRLKVLDLSMGEMTNEGVEYILNCSAMNQLHTLNLSMNYISNTEVLNRLVCHVIAQPQDNQYGDRYSCLYE
ncbi:hypothetical protein [Nostoc sp.]|uniref:hypothetical protein n=1 Tax=Nostoc sp. TaxID=1180 RepID=UPI002FFAF382